MNKPITYDAGDLEQQQQEDALWPWLADDSMADNEGIYDNDTDNDEW